MSMNISDELRDNWLKIIKMKSLEFHKSEKLKDLKKEGEDKGRDVCKLAAELTEEYRKALKLEVFLQKDYQKNLFSYAECQQAAIRQLFFTHKDLEAKITKVCDRSLRLPGDGMKLHKYKKQTWMVVHELENLMQNLEDELLKIEAKINEMHGLELLLQNLMKKEIKCSFFVGNIKGFEKLRAGKSCCNPDGSYLKGFYNLGKLQVLGEEKLLEEILGKTDISVSGYTDPNGKNGLQLRSLTPFFYRELGDPVEIKAAVAELTPGQVYELRFETDIKAVSMQLALR